MNRFRRLYFMVGIAALAVPLLVAGPGCHQTHEAEPAAESTSGATTVTVVYPTRQNIVRRIEQPGYNRPYEQTPLYSKIAGFVQKWNVDIGDHVKKGELLVELRVPEMVQNLKAKKARLEQAEAERTQAQEGLNAAKANVKTAKAMVQEAEAGVKQVEAEYRRWSAEYDRGKSLMGKNVYDQQTLDEALNQLQATDAGRTKAKAKVMSMRAAQTESEAKRNKAEADVEAALARVHVADADVNEQAAWLDYANIRAPYDGVITDRNIQTEDFVQPASSGSNNATAKPLYVVAHIDIIRVTVQVPEYDAVLVKDGDPAIVRYEKLGNREFRGKVTRATFSLDPQARTLRVEIHLHNTPKEELRPAMYANTTIEAELYDVLTVPAEAVLDDGEKHYCFQAVDSKAVRLNIRVGVRNKQVVQVLQKQAKPAKPGEEGVWEDFTGAEPIIASNPGSLLDGQPVTLQDSPRPDTAAQAATGASGH